MRNWFTSLNGAITLSVIALITELWRAFVDFQQEYSHFLSGTGAVLLGTLVYTALFCVWGWALLRAAHGQRGGLITALVINTLFLLAIPVGTLVAYCPSPCRTLWPMMELASWINLITGLLAAIALVVQLRKGQTLRPGHAG
jgi:hypothetical protein